MNEALKKFVEVAIAGGPGVIETFRQEGASPSAVAKSLADALDMFSGHPRLKPSSPEELTDVIRRLRAGEADEYFAAALGYL